MEDREILAKDARQIADTTNALLNNIYKAIKEEAKEGRVYLTWAIQDYSAILVQKVKEELVSKGFTIETTPTDCFSTITICW